MQGEPKGFRGVSRYDVAMEIINAQKDVRETFMWGFPGQLVSAVVWFASAAARTWHSHRLAEYILVLGGFFIFPLTQLLLRSMGRAHALPKGHPMNALAVQVAFTLPLTLPLVIGIAALRPVWFYPAFMITLGAHYLPFIFLYGMREFGILSATLIVSGVVIAMYVPTPVSLGAWLTGAILLVFALVARSAALEHSHFTG